MKYFIDTEFLEGTQKTWFGETKPTIDLISIGIVAEDGRKYYAISKEFNLKEAWIRYDLAEQTMFEKQNDLKGRKVFWIRDNVIKPIHYELSLKDVTHELSYDVWCFFVTLREKGIYSNRHYKTIKKLIKKYGKTNNQIAKEVKDFVYKDPKSNVNTEHQFYGYYSDYDWVAFCWLFGRMIDLPSGFPMYCIDLKQTLDEKQASRFGLHKYKGKLANDIKKLPGYPKQTNEHNALSDAKWNFELYKFLDEL